MARTERCDCASSFSATLCASVIKSASGTTRQATPFSSKRLCVIALAKEHHLARILQSRQCRQQ